MPGASYAVVGAWATCLTFFKPWQEVNWAFVKLIVATERPNWGESVRLAVDWYWRHCLAAGSVTTHTHTHTHTPCTLTHTQWHSLFGPPPTHPPSLLLCFISIDCFYFLRYWSYDELIRQFCCFICSYAHVTEWCMACVHLALSARYVLCGNSCITFHSLIQSCLYVYKCL